VDLVGRIAFQKVSGGAVSRDGHFIAIRREDFAQAWYRADVNESLGQTLLDPATPIPVVGPPIEPNGEGITFLLDDSGYMTVSEGVNQPIYFFPRLGSTVDPEFVGSPRMTPQGLELQVSGCAGTNVALERSTDLQTWFQATDFQATGEVQTIRDSGFTDRVFYRLRTE
jgi:hypothetical protein